MQLYLGNSKVKLNINNKTYFASIYSNTFTPTAGVRLLSSDEFYLTDSNGVQLLAKEDN